MENFAVIYKESMELVVEERRSLIEIKLGKEQNLTVLQNLT